MLCTPSLYGEGMQRNSAVGSVKEPPVITSFMGMDLGRIVRITNITGTDFSHPYHGQVFTVKANEGLLFPYDLGRHLAKHLARRIMFSNATTEQMKNDRALYNEDDESSLIQKILGEESNAPISPELSEAERLAKRVSELNANKPEGAPTRTKVDVIEEMKAKGLPVDSRKSLATLEAELAKAI